MERVKRMFEQDLFARHSGIELVSVSPGHATARMVLQPWHLNGVGTTQGGAIFTLADFAFAAAANSREKVAVAVNVSITFMKAAATGTLTAEAQELAVNPKLATYTVNVTDQQNNLIAVFQGLAYRKTDQP